MKRNEKGQVLVLVALAIFVLLGFAALGIDVGYMYSVRHELQRCADAGALAGASPFTTKDWNESSVQAEAEALARDFASKDNVVQTPLNRDSEVYVKIAGLPYGHIAVDTSRNVDLFFGRILGIDNMTITAHAMAKVSNTDKIACVKPWAIPLPWVDDNTTNGLFDNPAEADSVKELCAPGQVDNTNCWAKGWAMTLKIGSPSMDNTLNSGQQTSGQFFIIQGNVSDPYHGANTYREYIAGENCLDVDLNQPVDLMPGNKMGPTVQPVEDLIRTGPDWVDTSIDPPSGDNNNRLVFVVVYDPRVSITGGGGQTGGSGTQAFIPGNTSVRTNLWYAGFYLDAVEKQGNDGWVTGKYTGIMLSGTGTNQGSPVGNVAKHVELVE